MPRSRPAPPVWSRSTPWRLAAVVALALTALGCSEDSEPRVGDATTTPVAEAPRPPQDAPLQVTSGSVQGFLTESGRAAAVTAVADTVDSWIEQAWVAGPWPRTVGDVWAAFTPEAARSAAADATVTSAAGHAERVSDVRVARRDVTVDLLAQQGTAHGATARIALSFDVTPSEVTDGSTGKVAVRGRVFLTPAGEGWKIFGHDLTRGGW